MHNRRLKLERREQGGQMQEEIEEMGADLAETEVNYEPILDSKRVIEDLFD